MGERVIYHQGGEGVQLVEWEIRGLGTVERQKAETRY